MSQIVAKSPRFRLDKTVPVIKIPFLSGQFKSLTNNTPKNEFTL